MDIEQKKRFIIHFIFAAILTVLIYVVLKYGLPIVMPFLIAFLIAYLIQAPIRFISRKLHFGKKPLAILIVLFFYLVVGLGMVLMGLKTFSTMKGWITGLPGFYRDYAAPVLVQIFDTAEEAIKHMDPALVPTIEEVFQNVTEALGQLVSNISVWTISVLSGAAASLPAMFIKLLITVISTFFIAMDYETLIGFLSRQLSGKTKTILIHIKEYVAGTLFVCIRSYALIMLITFIELAVGLSVLQMNNAIIIALCIAIFDILPVLGTGGIMIPWALLSLFQGNMGAALGLVILYLVITVIRNILEPKIVGKQIGLHPVVTLLSMFVGAQLLGVIGLFGFPIGLSLLRNLNDNGTIHIFK